MKIQDTKAFEKMNVTQQRITLMRSSRQRIYNNVEVFNCLGEKRWKEIATALPIQWRSIVKELAGQ